MYIEHVPNRDSPPAIVLRESYRDGNKVKKRTLANLSTLPAEVIEGLKVLLRGGVAVPSAEEAFVIERSLPHGHVAAVLGAARACGAEQWFAPAPAALRAMLMALLVARVVSPALKLATHRMLRDETATHSLSRLLKLGEVARNRLKGTEAIALRVGRVIDHYRMGEHFELSISDSNFTCTRKAEQIRQEAALDGLYVVRTSVPAQDLPAEAAVTAYKGLAVVERAFRSLKTVDLQVRPVFHWNAQRVRAHVFLCMLAYYVEWHMRETLKPMLFDDEYIDLTRAARSSPVAKARRSDQAKAKDATRLGEDGLPVHSFRTLLDDLATLAYNVCYTPLNPDAKIVMTTRPTPVQEKAFRLLNISPAT